MDTLRDPLGAIQRFVAGDHRMSPRQENLIKRILSREVGTMERRRAYTEAECDHFARAACTIARQMVDNWSRGERDRNDRLIHRRPTKNAVALAAFRELGGRSRARANEVFDAAMTPERLARLGLTNPLDELSVNMGRTVAR